MGTMGTGVGDVVVVVVVEGASSSGEKVAAVADNDVAAPVPSSTARTSLRNFCRISARRCSCTFRFWLYSSRLPETCSWCCKSSEVLTQTNALR